MIYESTISLHILLTFGNLFKARLDRFWMRYGDGACNTVENSSIFSLIRMC